MASNRDCRTKPSVAQTVFGKIYVPWISEMVWKTYGTSYDCYQDQRNTWRAQIPYTAATEYEIVLQTKVFITCLNHHVGALAENPQFISALVKEIVDYLSAYTMRNPNFPERTRKKAKEDLTKDLWDNFGHIQLMLARQDAQRQARAERNMQYHRGGKSQHTSAQNAYAKANAVRNRINGGRNSRQK